MVSRLSTIQFSICVFIPQIHIIQDYGILYYTVVSYVDIFEYHGIFNLPIDNAAAGDQAVFSPRFPDYISPAAGRQSWNIPPGTD